MDTLKTFFFSGAVVFAFFGAYWFLQKSLTKLRRDLGLIDEDDSRNR